MMQLPFEALSTVTGRLAERLGNGSRREDAVVSDKVSKDSEFEDLSIADDFTPVQEVEEPCAEPDVEPSPVEKEKLKPPVIAVQELAHESGHGRPLATACMVLALLGFISLTTLLTPVTSPPSAPVAPAPVQSAAPAEYVLDATTSDVEEEAPAESDDESLQEDAKEDVNVQSTYTVGLTRHSFPVSTVGDIVYYRSAYFGTLHVGEPAVPFKVVFDTGSGHLILPSTYCQSETCRAHRRYRRSDSKTAQDIDYDGTPVMPGQPRDQITVSFGTGEVTGVFIEDIVCMHGEDSSKAIDNSSAAVASSTAIVPAAGSQVGDLERGCVKLRLIAATAMSEEPFKSFQFDGVLGLGLDGLSQAPEFNFLDIVAASFDSTAGNTPHTFAVFLAEDAEEESKITFGGWDEGNLMEDLSWNDVVDPAQGHWTIRIKALRIDDEVLQLCHEGCKGVVDTGTSLLAVPAMAFSELYTLLRHPAHMEGHCHGPGPQLHIELEHFTVTLGPEDYARLERTPPRKTKPRFESKPHNVSAQGRTDLHCKPMLMSMDLPAPLGPKLFILGEPVLRKYYSVYDAKDKRVGFARARHHLKPTHPLREDMTPALKKDPVAVEKAASAPKSMFEAFRWRKLHRYGSA